MANFWGKLFGQKESPVFKAKVGEGMTDEQTKKAYEVIAKPDAAMKEAKAKSFWGKTKALYTPVETDVRFPFQAEPTKVQAAPITKVAARATYDLIEAIPRFVATVGGEFAAGFQPKEVKANIDLRRFGFDTPNYQTASKEFTDAVNNGENPWIAGLRTVSNKTLDVAFGASMITDLAKMSTAVLLRGGAEARVEAQSVVDAMKANQKATFERLKNAPLEQRERALAEITNTKNQAEKVLNELGKPTAADKLKIKASRYTEVLGRETPITKNFWGDFAKPDIGLKTGPVTKAPLLEVKQLPGTRETPGQAPAMGLSMKKMESVGKEEARLAVSKELANYEAAPITVNGKPYITDVDAEFTLSQLKDKDASGKTLTYKEIAQATEAFNKIGIDPFKVIAEKQPTPEVPKYQSIEDFINEKPSEVKTTEDPLITEAKKYKSADEFIQAQQPKKVTFKSALQNKDYMGGHEAPMAEDINAPIWDLTGKFTGNNLYPEDIYSYNASRLYSSGMDYDSQAISILQSIRNRPNASVTIYRAVPKDIKGTINPGDWVTLTKEYAIDHGVSNLDGKYKIIKKIVKARDIFTDANSIQEFGYDPQKELSHAEKPYEILMRGQGKGKPTVNDRYIKRLTDTWNEAQKTSPKIIFNDQESFIDNILREGQPPVGSNNVTDVVARERFNISKLEKLSFGGSDRDVYDLGDGNVLKVAKTARGLDQNRSEGEPYAPVPKMIEEGKNYVVVQKAGKPDAKTKKLVSKLSEFKDFNSRVPAVDMINKTAEFYFNEGDEEMGSLIQDLNNYEVMINDLTSIRNWGTIDGEPVLLDAGTLNNSSIDNYKGVKNLEDPEFRDAFNQSKIAKKKFGDTDVKTMYQDKSKAPSENLANFIGKSSKTFSVQEQALFPDKILKQSIDADIKFKPLFEDIKNYRIDWNKKSGIDGMFAPDIKKLALKGDKDAIKEVQLFDGVSLRNIIDYPQFFAAYPSAKNIRVQIGNFSNSSGSFFIELNGTPYIRLNPVVSKNLKETLKHEIQHYIQAKEGWSRGGTPSELGNNVDMQGIVLERLRDNLWKDKELLGVTKISELNYIQQTIDKVKNRGVMMNDKEIEDFFGTRQEMNRLAYAMYKHLYGEIEATANSIPKINSKDYIFKKSKSGETSLSLKEGRDEEKMSFIKDQIAFLEGSLSDHPGKILTKYVSKTTGILPEITGKQTMMSLTGSGKEVKTSKFGREGDQILQEIAGYGKDPNEILQQYKNIKESVDDLKQQVKEAKSAVTLQKISEKLAKHQEKMIQFAEKYPKLAILTQKLSEEATKGAIKGYRLGAEVASREIKKEVMTNIKAAYDKKVASIKDNKEILANRRSLIKAVTKQFGLSDSDLKTITQRDIRLMSNFEFKQFLDNIRAKSEEFMVRRQAQNELVAQINEKELNIEPLREAMKLPPISQMNTEQLRTLDATLEPYKQGDVFLSKRKLEVIDRTDLKDIKTYREAREILAKKIGVKPEDLDKIKIGEFDRFKGFSSLNEKDPFFKMVTEETTKLKLQAEAEYLAIEEQANKLAKKIKTSFVQKIIPQQKNIRAWFEATDKSTVRLTKEEADLANFMMKEWGKARDELVIKEVMKRGIKSENYFTHIRRGILEAIKEDGLKQALKEIFDQYKLDEANFNILDQETGDVLAMDKFFRFALKRTGGLKPTENILGAFLSYMRTFKKKQALDEIVPLFDTYARALTPPGTTEKGLLLHADMIRFMKEWLNTQKGRRVNLLSKEGGKIDWALKSTKAFTTLLDIGLNLPVSVATQVGEQAIQYQLLGKGKFLKAKYRSNTARGRRITNKYRNLVGKNPWTQLIEPMRSIGDRLNEGIFTLFQDANVRRNKNVLLGLMTKEEWASETISPERLAQIKIATGRYGVVEGLGSIIGATPESKIATQYKTWAIPILTSQVKNLTYMAKYLGTLGKANKKEASRAFAEIWRMLELGAFTAIVAGAFVDKEDDSFLGKLKLRAIQEAYTLFGAAPAMTTVPRMIGFLTDLAKNTISLLKLEEYKATKFGEYEAGDLRGLEALQKQFTPRAVKQFDQVPVKTIDDIKAEIKADIESGALSVTAAKEKYVSELNKLKTADKKARFELKPDEYKKDLAERIKNKEITVSDAKQEYLDYAETNIDSFKSPDEGTFIDKVILYAKAIGTDPVTASIYLFQGETLRRIDNGAIIVKRMPLVESAAYKKEQGATKDMNLDHTVPLELGGSNAKSNLRLVNTDEWASYTPVENYLGDKLRSGMIEKKEAQRLIKEFKDGKISKEEIMK